MGGFGDCLGRAEVVIGKEPALAAPVRDRRSPVVGTVVSRNGPAEGVSHRDQIAVVVVQEVARLSPFVCLPGNVIVRVIAGAESSSVGIGRLDQPFLLVIGELSSIARRRLRGAWRTVGVI